MSKKRFKNRSTSPQNIEVDSDSESVLTPEPEQEELEEEEVTAVDDLSLLDQLHNGGLPHVLRDSDDDDAFIDDSDDHDAVIDPEMVGKGRKHSAAASSSAGDGMGTSIPASPLRRVLLSTLQGAPPVRGSRPPAKPRGTKGTHGHGRGRATRSPPPPQADSPEHRTSRVDSCEVEATRSPVHEPRVDEPQVDEPSTHETPVPRAFFQETPEQSRDEGTSQEIQWDTWPEASGHAGSDEELGEGATIYQRGSSGLPLVPATPEQRWSIRPNGEKGWIVAKGVRKPNIVLGVLLVKTSCGLLRCPVGSERPTTGVSRDMRRTRQRLSKPNVAAYFKTFGTRLGCRLDKAKCRDAKMEKEHYMKVPPRWCVDKMDCWEAFVDQWCSETWEASHNNAKERRGKMPRHNKTEAPQMYDLYAMAHTASYKKVKAFSESDLEHPENFTNISSHDKLVKYTDHGMARKGEDFNPSEGPIDPELAAIEKEREAMQAAMVEKDKEIRELEERTTALVEAERARNDASTRAIYELFVLQKGILSQFSPKKGREEKKNERKEEEEKKKKEEEKKEEKEEKKEKEPPPSSSFFLLLLLIFFFFSSSFSFSSSSSSSSSFFYFFFSSSSRSLDSSNKA
ncbi:hypothetical protein ZWY2020_008949 [Hordeum vulgare]|nr:hypothetical protein ZWY2020_008949 [Hordeum vulgare]